MTWSPTSKAVAPTVLIAFAIVRRDDRFVRRHAIATGSVFTKDGRLHLVIWPEGGALEEHFRPRPPGSEWRSWT